MSGVSINGARSNPESQLTPETPGPQVSKPWFLTGLNPERYQLSRKNGEVHLAAEPGTPSQSWAATMNVADAEPFRGQRIKMNAEVKTEAVEGGAGAWLRIDDAQGRLLAIDNQAERALLQGDHGWTDRAVILDVPQEAATLNYGSLQSGQGTTSIRNVRFETVDQDTPVTAASTPAAPFAHSGKSTFQAR